MADGYPLTVLAGGLTFVVSITPAATVFTDAALTVPATFPATITTDTTWYCRGGPYQVSATYGGVEVADSSGVATVYTNSGSPTFVVNPVGNLSVAKAELGDLNTPSSTLRVGGAPQSAYTVEMGQDNDGVVSDLSFVRIRARASRGLTSPASFFGESALRVEYADTASVVGATTAPYGYAVRARVSLKYGRNQSAIDDVVGVCVTNQSFADSGTAFNGTEAIYIGWGQGSTGGVSKDWNAGIGIDTVADKAIYINRGPYDYGILMTTTFTSAAIRIPNNSLIVGRNAADSASLNMMKVDTSNNVRLGSGPVKVAVGAPTADADVSQPFEVHAPGITDGNVGRSQQRLVDTTAQAANVGGTLTFAGYQDATPVIRSFAAITGRKANSTSGNAAGYLSLWSRNSSTGLVEVLRLTELQKVQVTEGVDFTLGTTTGTKIGSTTNDKLGFWNATPIVKPAAITGSRGANAALASLLTALASTGLITDSTTA